MADTGFLTEHDLKFLRGQVEYDDDDDKAVQKRTQKRYRIRQRTRQAIKDFTVLRQHLDKEDQRKIFGEDKEENEELLEGLVSLLTISYANFWSTEQAKSLMADVVGEAIARSEVLLGGYPWPPEVTVDIEITRNPLTIEMLENFINDRPEDLSLEQIGYIAVSGEFDEEDIEKIRESWEYSEEIDLWKDVSYADKEGPDDQEPNKKS